MSDDRALFRRAADYRRRIASRPQRPEQTCAKAVAAWRAPMPEHGEEGAAIIDESHARRPTALPMPVARRGAASGHAAFRERLVDER